MARYAGGGKNTVESCRNIDVLEWNRRGYLRSARWFSWAWTRDGDRAHGASCYTAPHHTCFEEEQMSDGRLSRDRMLFSPIWHPMHRRPRRPPSLGPLLCVLYDPMGLIARSFSSSCQIARVQPPKLVFYLDRTNFQRDWRDFDIWGELLDRAVVPSRMRHCKVAQDASPDAVFPDPSYRLRPTLSSPEGSKGRPLT